MSAVGELAHAVPFRVDPGEAVLSTVVERWAARDPDRVCIATDAGEEVTYAQLDARAGAVAAGLAHHGVGAGDRVVTLYAANGPRVADVGVALAKLGAIEVPVNPALVGVGLDHVISEVEPRAAVVDTPLRRGLDDALGGGLRPLVVEWADQPGEVSGGAVALDELVSATTDHVPTAARPGDPAAIMYTSGTTGPPKGAIVPHRHLLGFGVGTAALFDLTPDDVLLTALPLFHAGGRGMNLVACLLTGARCALVPRFSPTAYWEQAVALEATAAHMVVSMAHMMMAHEPTPAERQHRISRALVAPPTDELAAAFTARYGPRVLSGYASTEAGVCIITTDGPVAGCGRALPPYRAWVVDEEDRRLGPDEVGELVIASDEPWTTFSGYWRRPETTVTELRNFGFHTGDAVRMDPDGTIWYVDRIKDMIRRRGENISAFLVEQAVVDIDGVQGAAAFGVPSDLGEEEVAVAVVLEPGAELTAEQIADACRGVLPRYAVPTFVRFVDALPLTPTGKVQKTVLREVGTDGAQQIEERRG